MGEYFLWGYFNERPVYQHVSGLDFLYFHKNNVWGAGPKIGGNSAGLLNFGRNSCPYKLGEFSSKNICQIKDYAPIDVPFCIKSSEDKRQIKYYQSK